MAVNFGSGVSSPSYRAHGNDLAFHLIQKAIDCRALTASSHTLRLDLSPPRHLCVQGKLQRTDPLNRKISLSKRKYWTIASGQAIFLLPAENRIRNKCLVRDK